MSTVLWYTLPIAVAIALSVFPIVAVLVLLLAPDPMRRSVAFTSGWAVGLLLLVAVFTVSAKLTPHEARVPFPPWAHMAEIAIGVILLGTALFAGRRGERSVSSGRSSLSGLTSMSGPRAFAFGLMMNVRPKNIVLTVAAGLAIGAASLDLAASVTIVVVVTVVGASTVAGLVLVYAVGKSNVRPGLERLRRYLVEHASTVLRILAALIGALLVVIGTVQLLSS
ncbi:UNVERIFIED_CONTAM: GAP family protein [Microbacterium sp. SLM126]